MADASFISTSFLKNGYCCIPKIISNDLCNSLKNAFYSEVKSHTQPMLRQTTTKMERHNFCSRGYITNPLLNVHNLDSEKFPTFIQSVKEIFNDQKLTELLIANLDCPIIIETMYFESSRGTFAHVDSHFMDTNPPGLMLGYWLALEDINESDGCFFVYPTSHHMEEQCEQNTSLKNLIANYHLMSTDHIQNVYESALNVNNLQKIKKLLFDIISKLKLEKKLIPMKQGDLVVFHSDLLHGSLAPSKDGKTRNSLTFHAIPNGKQFLKQKKLMELHTQKVGSIHWSIN